MPKILVCGNDKEFIDKLFKEEKDAVMFMSTTDNTEDIKRHLKVFIPTVFAFCLKNQSAESYEQILEAFPFIQETRAGFVLIGSDSEMDVAFAKFGAAKVSETYSTDLGFEVIMDRLINFEATHMPAINPNAPSTLETMNGFESLDAISETVGSAPRSKIEEKKKILVVDDDANMLRTLKLYLQDKYTVAVANAGAVALRYLEDKTVDLILLDYMMPNMDGPTVFKYLRSSVLTHRIPVIFLTGVSDRDKIRDILRLKVQGYLLKPVEKDKLHEAIDDIFNGETPLEF